MLAGPSAVILNVADREDVRDLRTRPLREAGFEVREAGDGHEALRLVTGVRPDLILLDIPLSGLDGLATCRRIKADPATASVLVVHVSAAPVDRETRVAALDNGADGFLAGPLEPAELVATVRALLRSRLAQVRLRESQKLVKMLFEAAPALMVALDGDGRIVLFNRACEQLTGYREDEVMGRPLLDLTPPAWRERVAAFVAGAGPEALAAPHEQPWLTRGGEERLIEWRCFKTADPPGDTFVFGVGHDVTERHQANARQFLQFSVTRALADARSMDEAAPTLLEAVCMILRWDVGEFWAVDRDAGLIRLSASWAGWVDASALLAAAAATGVPPGEGLPGHAWQEGKPVWMRDVQTDPRFVHKDAAVAAGLRTAVAFPVLVAGEVLAVLVFHSRRLRDVDPLLLAALADIGEQVGQFTQRTRADAALRASEARLRLALDGAGIGWWEWDVRGRKVTWSPELDALLGLSGGAAGTAERLLERVHPDDRMRVESALVQAVAGSSNRAVEFRVVRPDGTARWAAARGSPVCDEAGRTVSVLGVAQDVTAAKGDEEERERLAELGHALNETLDLDVLLPKVAEAARQLCRADAARVSFHDSPVYGCDESGMRRYEDPALRLTPGVGIEGRVLATGRSFRTDQPPGDPRVTAPPAPGIVAALAVPIQSRDRCEGVLGVYNRTARSFTDRDEARLRRLAVYAAVACRNAEMYRRAEVALDHAEVARRGTARILESMTDAFAAVDREGRVTYVNAAAARLVGRERSELIGKVLWEEFPEMAGSRFATEFDRAMAEQTTVQFDEYYPRLGLWLEVRAHPSTEGFLVYVRDVTERRRGEVLLRSEKQVLELLAQGAPLADALEVLTRSIEQHSSGMLASILLVDPDGLHLRHGAAPSLPAAYTQAIDGMAIGPDAGPCGAAAYRCATVIVADIARDPTWQSYRDLALPHGLRACWSTPIVAGDGTVLGTFALYYREPRVPDGRDLRLIETAAHIARVAIERQRADTERATLFARAEGARAEAEAANRAKDHFLAVLSHELRNPLAAIANAVASLDRIGLQRPDAVRLREIVRRQVQHLRRLLDDLLDVTRLAYGKLDLRREPLDLREVVSRCVEGLESSGRLAGHPVTIVPGPESVPVEGDRVRLEQIVGNLLDNAAKYSPEGRSITVAVGRAEGQAVLRVRDAGIGLEPGALERIFEPFAQLRGQPGGGLGLGLALARGLVRQHGGSIVARSEGEGRGSEFEVRLPLAPEAAGRRAVSAAGPAPRRRRIVVVEDLADARATLTTLLELLGHEVQAAADGERAVEMILAMRPDVALVDVGLPGIDGHEVARRVRAAVGGAVYLVALTGYGQPYDRERAHQAGFDRHMVKPVDAAELERALGDHPLDPDAST